jgi:hypothetical protein
MADPSKLTLTEWVSAWKRAGPALDAVKRSELRRLRTSAALEQLRDHFDYALRTAKKTKTSGLVEQQRIFRKLRRG